MKPSILIPVITLLPATAYGWHVGIRCCETTVRIMNTGGYYGCVGLSDPKHHTQVAVTPSDDAECYRKSTVISGVYAPILTLAGEMVLVETESTAIQTGFDFKEGLSALRWPPGSRRTKQTPTDR
ncbi:hypothetical protein FKW77_000662 [Venturia effusa]|uniref:Uncharacterized protein n=1 Tax=Venturia effusa TaxID=50376 RepID=A0A517L2N2_9PEZI|nr:hypothetical protein FKW77_000662 [Venturia effusa]